MMVGAMTLHKQITEAVFDALDRFGAVVPFTVELDGEGQLIVKVRIAGIKQGKPTKPSSAAKKPGRPAKSSPPPVDNGAADKILKALGKPKNQRGLNLVSLTKAIGMKGKEKVALKPVVAQLMKSKQLTKVGQLFRRNDVVVQRARSVTKAKSAVTKSKPTNANEKPGAKRPAKSDTKKPAANERYSRDAVLAALEKNTPGYSLVDLALALGGRRKTRMQLKPALALLMKERGESQVELKSGKYRLKNVERSVGRPSKSAAPSSEKKSPPKNAKPVTNKKPAAAAKSKKADRPAKPAMKKSRATTKKSAKVDRAKAAKAKATKLVAKAGKKKAQKAKKGGKREMKVLPETTDETGQIPRDETRREASEATQE